uniref:Uncharacterized protein MANES_02G082800 n=1 Tax=Rhizophora mucronata TaxID=61149 RepID=A0A2P2LH58_RHIMU
MLSLVLLVHLYCVAILLILCFLSIGAFQISKSLIWH